MPFRTGTFCRPSRIAALERIGHHTHYLDLRLHRNAETFLPPLINASGEEEAFAYTPNASSTASAAAKYGSEQIADMLVKQYPPLFHSSTNVPSFVRALSALRNLREVDVSSTSTSVTEGRRSTVDYALISLRVALERAPLPHLDTLSFSPIYPSGLLYMQPLNSLGATPASVKRWSHIRHLSIAMESSSLDKSTRSDQLKTLHNYLRTFAGSLSSFHFRWHGCKGPSPISLDSEPGIFFPPQTKDRNARTYPSTKDNIAIKFTALHHVNVQNAEVDASQISAFICQHRRTLEEFKFESIKLRTGNWEQALSPLAKFKKMRKDEVKLDEKMEVPIMLSVPVVKPEPTPMVDVNVGEDANAEEQKPAPRRKSVLQRLLSMAKARKARDLPREADEQHIKSIFRTSVPWR